MRILIAPNAFKGTYSSPGAAKAIASGLRRAGFKGQLDLLPLADGGPGTFACMKGVRKSVMVHDVLGRKRKATWLLLPSGIALIESAQAIGLTLISQAKRNALLASSDGLGELILAAKKAGCSQCLVGLGGSASTDAGLGMACALGWTVTAQGKLKAPAKDPIKGLRVKVLCDVDNPLFGRRGAAYVYAPQKGASRPQVLALDHRLRWVGAQFPKRLSSKPGAGAAGGLGFGLMAFCRARLLPGAKTLLKMNGFEARAKASDWILSGEGRFDAQSLSGKLPYTVAREAKRLKKPCVLMVGQKKGSFPGLNILELPSRKGLEALALRWWKRQAAVESLRRKG